MNTETVNASAVDQQRLVGPHCEYREFDPRIELPRWLDEYKWHRDDVTWSQCGRDWTADRLNDPHYPKVWRTRRPNV